MSNRKMFVMSISLKLSLVAMLIVAWATDASQFEGKGLGARLVFYPLGVLVVPAVWYVYRRVMKRRVPFPYAADILITLPFVIDTAGNWFDLFDRLAWWDDAMHFFLWSMLVAGIAEIVRTDKKMTRWHLFFIAAGIGAQFAIWWELAEYFAFVPDNPSESLSAYRDSIGDLVLGSTGGIIAAAVSARVLISDEG